MARYDQDYISHKISQFLTREKREQQLINSYIYKGKCAGYSALWLYVMWLDRQPKTSDKPRDDLAWWLRVMNLLSSWDGQSQLDESSKGEIDRLISYIEYFQNSAFYDRVVQNEWHLTCQDSKGKAHSPKKEYGLSGFFTEKNFTAVLNKVIKTNRLNIISSMDHNIALIKEIDKKGKPIYFLYDSNETQWLKIYQNHRDLAKKIFSCFKYQAKYPSRISIRAFSINEAPCDYPKPETLYRQYASHKISLFKLLFDAIKYSDYKAFHYWDKHKLNKLTRFELNKLLGFAGGTNNPVFVRLLINKGAQIDRALRISINNNELLDISNLSNMGYDVSTVIYYMLRTNKTRQLRKLFKMGLNISGMIKRNAVRGREGIILKLIHAGANPTQAIVDFAKNNALNKLKTLKSLNMDASDAFLKLIKQRNRQAILNLLLSGFDLFGALIEAEKSIDIASLKFLLGCCLTTTNLIIYCGNTNHLELIKKLGKAGAHLENALYYASYYGFDHAIRNLIKLDTNTTQILQSAIRNNHPQVISHLILHGISIEFMVKQELERQNIHAIRIILQTGFNPSQLIQHYIDTNNDNHLSLLIKAGADCTNVFVDAFNDDDIHSLQSLTKCGADPAQALYYSALVGNKALVSKMLNYNVQSDKVIRTLAIMQNLPAIKLLANCGADIDKAGRRCFNNKQYSDYFAIKDIMSRLTPNIQLAQLSVFLNNKAVIANQKSDFSPKFK